MPGFGKFFCFWWGFSRVKSVRRALKKTHIYTHTYMYIYIVWPLPTERCKDGNKYIRKQLPPFFFIKQCY